MVDMRIEEHRIFSFHSWPNNAPVDKERLARGGFFATGNYLEAQCAWCNKKISDWQYGDQVTVRHRRLDPLCVFLLNPNESGNVPIVSSSTISAQSVNDISNQHEENFPQGNLKDEAVRLATFKNWPNSNISPQSLAKAGFYYINKSDHVRCAWCFGVIAKWEKGDSAFGEHQRFFPDCPRVQLGPLIEITSDGIRDLGIQQISPPRKPKYSSLDARLRTFIDWPIVDIQQPEVLAKAGFYSQQLNDLVRCFHCYGGLRSWQKEDDPWFEHAKWFPHCQFIRLVKGVSFVNEVQSMHNQSSKQTALPGAGYSNANENNTINNFPSIGNSSSSNINNSPMMVHSTTVDNAMVTEPVLQALEMGLNEGRIRNAIQRRIENTGRTYETTEELIEAVLDRQADEEDEDSASERSSSLVREVSRILNNIFHPQNFITEDEDEASVINNFNSSSPLNNFHHSGENSFNTNNQITEMRNLEERPEQNEIALSSDDQLNGISSESNLNHNNEDHCNAYISKEPSQNIEGNRSTITASTSDETSEKLSTAEETCSTVTATTGRKLTLEEENRLLKEARTCKVCMDEEVGVVFLPCAHFVTCVQCAPGVNSCPLCRSPIKGFVRTFLS